MINIPVYSIHGIGYRCDLPDLPRCTCSQTLSVSGMWPVRDARWLRHARWENFKKRAGPRAPELLTGRALGRHCASHASSTFRSGAGHVMLEIQLHKCPEGATGDVPQICSRIVSDTGTKLDLLVMVLEAGHLCMPCILDIEVPVMTSATSKISREM